jgi:hypothetical protein
VSRRPKIIRKDLLWTRTFLGKRVRHKSSISRLLLWDVRWKCERSRFIRLLAPVVGRGENESRLPNLTPLFIRSDCSRLHCLRRASLRSRSPANMNSYPPEFLVQLAPVMFVAGLGRASGPPSAGAPPTPVTPATPATPGTPATPATPATPGIAVSATPSRAPDAFAGLATRLRDVFATQRSPAIWAPSGVGARAKTFQIVLVDKVSVLPCYTLTPSALSDP